MTLSNEAFDLAHTLANQDASVDQLAGLIIASMLADTGKPFNPRPTIETVLFSVRLSCAKIVREEWQRGVKSGGVTSQELIARILDRINGVDDKRIVEDQTPLPLKRLTDLERRVEALEKRGSFGPKPDPNPPYVTTRNDDYQSWHVIIRRWDKLISDYGDDVEFVGKFSDAPTAKSHAIQYAADQGFEYRD